MKVSKENLKVLSIFIFLTFSLSIFAEWDVSSKDYASSRTSNLDQINIENLDKLEEAWIFNTGNFNSEVTVQSSPIYTGKHLITVGIYGDIYGLDPANGKKVWNSSLPAPIGRRGLIFSKKLNAIFVPTGDGIAMIHADDGGLIKKFPSGASLLKPILDGDKLFIATLKNGVKAFDINTEMLLWHNPLNLGNIQTRIWSGFSYDLDSKIAFINTANPGGLFGGKRTEDDLSTSLIAIDTNNGKILWQFQHIIHDVWDLDMVGDPIILENLKGKKSVLSFSKTGDLIYLDAYTGKPIFENSIITVEVPQSDVPGEVLSKFQKKIILPESVSNVIVDIENDFSHLDAINKSYVKSKLKYARSEEWLPPSLNYDALIYGLHGGPQWMGGALNFQNNSVIIPFNKDPWLLRLKYQDSRYTQIKKYSIKFRKLIDLIKSFFQKQYSKLKTYFNKDNLIKNEHINLDDVNVDLRWANFQKEEKIANIIYKMFPHSNSGKLYTKNCASCHGVARQGTYENEYEGDYYVPSLIGISKTKKGESMSNFKKLKKTHDFHGAKFNISKNELKDIYKKFIKLDNSLDKNGHLTIDYAWQFLLDKDGYPASKPPWGGIANVSLDSGKILWSVPFGARLDSSGEIVAVGDKNYGGVMTTKSGLVFASGTPDKMARAFDINSGRELWSRKMPSTGSAQPMTYFHKGCQYVAFVASGGQFVGFDKDGDSLVTFKLKDCNI